MSEERNVKVRAWFLTCNNPTDDDRANRDKILEKAVYSIWVPEVGKKRGTPHVHTYLRFKNPVSFNSIRKQMPRNDVRVAKGSDAQVLEYLSKENKPTVAGEPTAQGKRNDIEDAKAILKENPTMGAIIDGTNSYQAWKCAEVWLQYKEPPRPFGPRKVFWYYGSTGTGKSYTAFSEAPDAYTPKTHKWWNGYDGHKTIIIDELRGDWCKFHEILTILGETAFRVECKGGMRQAVYDTVYITSVYHPEDCWPTIEDKSQLLDRIDVLREFTGESIRKKLKVAALETGTEVESGTEVGGNNSPPLLCPDDQPRPSASCPAGEI